jgi:broad specificity phosphatase PhoE
MFFNKMNCAIIHYLVPSDSMTLDTLVSLLSFIIGSRAIHIAVKGRLFDSASIRRRNSENSTKQSIFIIRHGDRYDYKIGTERWEETVDNICPFHHIRDHDRVMHDPPLSDLGLKQTIDLGAYFAKIKDRVNFHRVVSSPFLRCIQTINPIAAALDLPICLDDAFFEANHTQIIDNMPTLRERATYFPRINMHYKSTLRPLKDEEYPAATIERFGEAIKALIDRFPDENIVVVTHAAAAVAMVARILGCKIRFVI